ncbi:transcription termination factor MTEF1, chloroplastic isoform X2 [Magnolia sinica]|uniref:transcription termination factor MTEF1, chloroplastic isoform X2 n=1 Tax=Magnolia sinica TaxID=86752 RepID=UPI0026592F00|nr:transcription termination factor MTEF1, chloroplastic isoform X2 [Magnolia sinica]
MILRPQLSLQTPSLRNSSQIPSPRPKPSLTLSYKRRSHHYHHQFPPKTPILDSGLLFRQKLLYLQHHLNVDPTKALTLNPDLRSTPISSLQSAEHCLLCFGIHRSDVGRIFGMHPILLTSSLHSHIYPAFEFLLNDVQIPFPDLRKAVSRCPRLLVSSVPHQLRPTLHFLRSLGFVGPHAISCQTSLLLVSSVDTTLMPKLDYIQSLGFSYREAVKMVLRSPGLFTFSIDNNFRPKVDYFVNEMKGDLRELKDFPQYFSFSLERKIKPRHRLLVEHGFSLRLADMLKVSDGEFHDRLVEMRLQTLDEKLRLCMPRCFGRYRGSFT